GVGEGGEDTAGAVGIHAVAARHGIGRGVQHAVVHHRAGKIVIGDGVVPGAGEVAGDVGGVGADGHRRGEVDLLPAGAGDARDEGGGGQEVAVGIPEAAELAAAAVGVAVEAQPGDVAADVGIELHTQLDRFVGEVGHRGRR